MKQNVTHEAGTANVLILEDEPLMAALIKRYIGSVGSQQELLSQLDNAPKNFTVKTLESGFDLITQDLSQYRVVVVDILLPQVTGVDLIRDFRKRFPHMGIVPVSGMATEPMKRAILEVMPDKLKFLPKPLRKEDFFQAFIKAWNFKEPEQQQVTGPDPAPQEGGQELWTTVKGFENTGSNIVVEKRRGLLRKKAA
jgi:CheY-like chemotaxis protein